MPISNRLVFLRSLTRNGINSRTAVYGPVRTVVWQGSVGDHRPYADQVGKSETAKALLSPDEGIRVTRKLPTPLWSFRRSQPERRLVFLAASPCLTLEDRRDAR